MPNKYPPIVIPPKNSKAPAGMETVFNNFINDHPIMRPYADLIAKYAKEAGVDKVVGAALLWHESFSEAARLGVSPDTITSPTGEGVGPGQINPKVWVGKKTPWGHVITQSDLTNPDFNIRFSMTYFASLPGSTDQKYARYSGGANYTLSTGLPKGYVPRSDLTPTQKGQKTAVQDAANTAAKSVLFDSWAVLTTNGKVKFVSITDSTKPPKNVLMYGPTPLTQTQFQTVWKQNYADTFTSYTGRQASGKEISNILKNAPSLYTLANTLALTPSFQSSPTYKAHAPGIVAIAKQALGGNWKVDRTFIAKAIAQNWDQATLLQNVKQLPEYQSGPQFKDDVAKATNVYTQIYGNADAGANTWIAARVKEGWTNDDIGMQLRNDPAYKQSQEYKSRVLSFAQQLGLLTGHQVSLTADQAMLGGAPATPAPAPPAAPPATTTTPPVVSGPPMPYNPAAYVPGGAPANVAKAIQLAGQKGVKK